MESTTFRERGEEAATLNPKTTPWSHAQAVFLWVLPKNHLLQHWGDKSVESRQILLPPLHKQNQWGTSHGSWHKRALRLKKPHEHLWQTPTSPSCSLFAVFFVLGPLNMLHGCSWMSPGSMHTFPLHWMCLYRLMLWRHKVASALHSFVSFFPPPRDDFFVFVYTSSQIIQPTGVMVYPIGEYSFCRRLPVCLGGWHASKTIYTDGRGDAGHRGGADAWGSAATCSYKVGQTKTEETVSIPLSFSRGRKKKSFPPTAQLINVRGASPMGRWRH